VKQILEWVEQSWRQWNKCFDDFIASIGFERIEFDTCIYFKFLVDN